MNDPRRPLPGTPGPAGIPLSSPAQQPHAPQNPAAHRIPQAAPMHVQPSHAPHAAHPQQPHSTGPAKIAPMPTLKPAPADDGGAIALIDDGDEPEVLHKKIKAFGPEATVRQQNWTRQPKQTGNGAVRVKSFHAKFSDQGLEHLDEAINHFIDTHPEVDIKFVTTNVGMYDGKIKDVGMVVQVWY